VAIYQSSLRSQTKIIDGIEIGRYSHAYKESFSANNYPGGRGRLARHAEAIGEAALEKNFRVRHFIEADSFATATQDGYYVFEIDREPPVTTSDLKGTVVGRLRKVGGRFVFERGSFASFQKIAA
jgi:hypothetical protein